RGADVAQRVNGLRAQREAVVDPFEVRVVRPRRGEDRAEAGWSRELPEREDDVLMLPVPVLAREALEDIHVLGAEAEAIREDGSHLDGMCVSLRQRFAQQP